MDCAAPLASRGKVCVKFIYTSGATSTPPVGGAASYNSEPRGGNSGRPPLYGIVRDHSHPLAEELRVAYPGILSPLYTKNAAFGSLARQSAQLLKLLMKIGPEQGYFPKSAKSLFISDTPRKEEAVRREFSVKGLVLNFVAGSRYLGAYLGPQE